ncbi:DUF302 domain-containing protein [Patescibacteria group bacterium]|nr:DUF302 domain-containing protein [Patescibacteria group bacterium]MCH8889129.1 DUF302 domain-containing protein [Patescibacteria group bacterium]
MKYSYSKSTNLSFQEAIEKVKEELTKEGFGVLTEIDIKATLKEKLNIDFDNYVILGACNPPFAHKSLLAEKEIGLFLPCNVIVYEEDGKTVVSTIVPSVQMSMIENKELKSISGEVEDGLKKVIDSLPS